METDGECRLELVGVEEGIHTQDRVMMDEPFHESLPAPKNS